MTQLACLSLRLGFRFNFPSSSLTSSCTPRRRPGDIHNPNSTRNCISFTPIKPGSHVELATELKWYTIPVFQRGFGVPAMLYVVGLGLGDEKDITVRGLEAVRRCDKVYLEAYTSLLALGLGPDATATLEKLYGRPVIVADRELVEQGAEGILEEARTLNVAFLVVGDPFGATTHSDLLVRAKTLGIEVEVVHNASIMNAVGACGLQLYRFGEAISIPFFTDTWRPDSFYDKIKSNRTIGLHTLCLLDIRVKEQSVEALCRGKKEYEPPRYMSINTAIEQLLEVEESRVEKVYSEDTLCVGLARLGTSTQKIVAGPMKELLDVDFGLPLHSLVIAGTTHVMEEEFLSFYKPS